MEGEDSERDVLVLKPKAFSALATAVFLAVISAASLSMAIHVAVDPSWRVDAEHPRLLDYAPWPFQFLLCAFCGAFVGMLAAKAFRFAFARAVAVLTPEGAGVIKWYFWHWVPWPRVQRIFVLRSSNTVALVFGKNETRRERFFRPYLMVIPPITMVTGPGNEEILAYVLRCRPDLPPQYVDKIPTEAL